MLQDLESWFPLIETGGSLFGDDFDRESVYDAVVAFCKVDRHCVIDTEIGSQSTFVLRKLEESIPS